MYPRSSAIGLAILLALGVIVLLIMDREDGSQPESVEITKVPAGGLYASVGVALQDVPATGDRTAWARSWCHPTVCPDDGARANFAERQAGPHVADLPSCVTERRTLYVFKGWTERASVGMPTEHIVIDCRPVGRRLHVQAERSGTHWKLTAMQWEPPEPRPAG